MVNSCCDFNDGDGPTSAYSPVFIDSNLETHMAMIVSDVETVSDFKDKIVLEHHHCFPNFGEIQIDAVKVKRKGFFYHLSDSMLVKSAFYGVKNNWFLYIDASYVSQKIEPPVVVENFLGVRNNLPVGPYKQISIVNNSKLVELGSSQQAAPEMICDKLLVTEVQSRNGIESKEHMPLKKKKKRKNNKQKKAEVEAVDHTVVLEPVTIVNQESRKRKHKTANENPDEPLLDEDNTISERATNEKTVVPSDSLEYKYTSKNAVINDLPTESTVDVHFLEKDSGHRKKKHRVKSKVKNDQVVSHVPSELNVSNNLGEMVRSSEVAAEHSVNPAQKDIGDAIPHLSPCNFLKDGFSEPKTDSDVSQAKESELLDNKIILSGPIINVQEKEVENPEVALVERCEPLSVGGTETDHERGAGSRSSLFGGVKSSVKVMEESRNLHTKTLPYDICSSNSDQTANHDHSNVEHKHEESIMETKITEACELKCLGSCITNGVDASVAGKYDGEGELKVTQGTKLQEDNINSDPILKPKKKRHRHVSVEDHPLKDNGDPVNSDDGYNLRKSKKTRVKKTGSITDSIVQLPSQNLSVGSRLKNSISKLEHSNKEAEVILDLSETQKNSSVVEFFPENAKKVGEKTRKKNSKHKIVIPEVSKKDDDMPIMDLVVSNDKNDKMGKSRSTKKALPKTPEISYQGIQKISGEISLSHLTKDSPQERIQVVEAVGNVTINDQIECNANVMETEGDQVNFHDSFLLNQSGHDANLSKILTKEGSSNRKSEQKARKGSKKHEIATANEKPPSENIFEVQPVESFPDGNLTALSNKKPSNVSGFDPEAPSDDTIRDDLNPIESISLISSGTNKTASPCLKESSNQSKELCSPVKVIKDPKKNTGKTIESSEHKKTLLAKSGSILEDYNIESSEDEDGIENSDSSMKTPDNFLSSGFSEGESEEKPLKNVTNESEQNRQNGKDAKIPISASASNMSIDMVLRRSNRYKKAKQSVTQDPEMDNIDFVPDSIPI